MRFQFKFLKFLILILNLIFICNAANAKNKLDNLNLKLPDGINLKNAEWNVVSEQITNLNDFGVWINKAYKNNLNSWLEINLVTGMGCVNTDLNLKNLNSGYAANSKSCYAADGEYLILEIKGHSAIYESRAAELHLANALSVNLNDSSVLTIEAAMTKSELIEIAEYFIDFLNFK